MSLKDMTAISNAKNDRRVKIDGPEEDAMFLVDLIPENLIYEIDYQSSRYPCIIECSSLSNAKVTSGYLQYVLDNHPRFQ